MRTFAIFAAASVLLASSPAFADEVKFTYTPNDLATKASVEALYERIEGKAKRVCGVYLRADIQQTLAAKACAAALISDLVAKIGNSALIAEHENNQAYAMND